MSSTIKILGVVIILIVIATILSLVAMWHVTSRQASTIKQLELSLSECVVRERDVNAAMARQNAAIEASRVDTVVVERLIKGAEKKYVEIREVVAERLKEDSSCESQVSSIDFALRRFHGVTLHPEGGDEN